MKKLDQLPVFGNKNMPDYDPETWRLKVDGLVRSPAALTLEEILTLPITALTSDFSCVEGWTVEGIKWQGVRVRDLAERVITLPEAKFATFHAGSFIMSLPLEEATKDNIILAYSLDGKSLPREHGGPLRLITPSNDCFYSVKLVERVEFTESDAGDTGRTIALTRIGRV